MKIAIIPQGGRVGENKTLSEALASLIMVATPHETRATVESGPQIETQIMC